MLHLDVFSHVLSCHNLNHYKRLEIISTHNFNPLNCVWAALVSNFLILGVKAHKRQYSASKQIAIWPHCSYRVTVPGTMV
jgi:hypothetical protein